MSSLSIAPCFLCRSCAAAVLCVSHFYIEWVFHPPNRRFYIRGTGADVIMATKSSYGDPTLATCNYVYAVLYINGVRRNKPQRRIFCYFPSFSRGLSRDTRYSKTLDRTTDCCIPYTSNIIKINTTAMRSKISSKLVFASFVWYSDRAYCWVCVLIRDIGRRLPLELQQCSL